MGYLINPIKDLFEFTFSIIPSIGNNGNAVIISLAAIAGIIWIRLMMKYEKKEVPNR